MGSQAAAAAARGGTDGGPQPAPCVPERLRQCLQGGPRSARAHPEGLPEAFRASWMSAGERPFTWARQMEEAAVRWLRPGPTEEERCLLNLVVSLVKTAGSYDGF